MSNTAPHVYTAIAQVMEEMSKVGISKDRQNQQQGYKFRGIEDVMNALAPLLPKAKLVVIPRMMERIVQDKINQKGNVLIYTTVAGEFDFISAVDGSCHTARTYGEAMDSGDKSTNKAMSTAYKYACFQTFCIPTEGDDTENESHELAKPAATPTPRSHAASTKTSAATPKAQAPAPEQPQATTESANYTEVAGKLKTDLLGAGCDPDRLRDYYVAAFGNKAAQGKAQPQDYIPMLEWLVAAVSGPGQVDDFNSDPASFGKMWNMNHAKSAVN